MVRAVLIAFACLFSSLATSQAQYLDTTESVIHIGYFDFDRAADTLMGRLVHGSSFRPTRLLWGADSGSASRDTTRFHFPAWKKLGASTSIMRLNADTLDDLLIFVWGKVGQGGDESDTIRRIVIFGQSRLRSRNQVTVHALPPSQTSPFFALELERGGRLTEPRVRDYGGRTSWLLLPVTLDVRDTSEDGTMQPPLAVAGGPVAEGWIRVYPNPAVYAARVEGRKVKPGHYLVRLVSTNGQNALEAETTVAESGDLFHSLDLSDVPTGFFELQVLSGSSIVTAFPVVVVH